MKINSLTASRATHHLLLFQFINENNKRTKKKVKHGQQNRNIKDPNKNKPCDSECSCELGAQMKT